MSHSNDSHYIVCIVYKVVFSSENNTGYQLQPKVMLINSIVQLKNVAPALVMADGRLYTQSEQPAIYVWISEIARAIYC